MQFVSDNFDPCCSFPCQHGGICVPLSNHDHECDCTATGYYGKNCDIRKWKLFNKAVLSSLGWPILFIYLCSWNGKYLATPFRHDSRRVYFFGGHPVWSDAIRMRGFTVRIIRTFNTSCNWSDLLYLCSGMADVVLQVIETGSSEGTQSDYWKFVVLGHNKSVRMASTSLHACCRFQ